MQVEPERPGSDGPRQITSWTSLPHSWGVKAELTLHVTLENRTKESITGSIDRYGLQNIYSQQFLTPFFVPRWKITVSAAILCPALHLSDVINKACMYGKSTKYVTRELFSVLNWESLTQNGCAPKSSNSKQNNSLCLNSEQPNEACK